MRFTTLSYLIFFIIFYIAFWLFRGRARLALTVLFSLLFYGIWSWAFCLHFMLIMVVSYVFVTVLRRTNSRAVFIGAVALNLGNLFFFKYFYLFLDFLLFVTGREIFQARIFNSFLSGAAGVDSITLPLAISFYTFTIIAYLADTYTGKIQEKADFLEFATFILFFPHLVAGPIMRHSDFFYQLKQIQPNEDRTIRGLFLVAIGLFKKVVIADNVGQIIAPVYANPGAYDWSTNALAAVGYAIRVYCDFSGYTDIALGSAALVGLDLPQNFMGPFLSRSVREFWRNWHVTLAAWLRDYVFIPLGGSRISPVRTYAALIITFTLGGLWHGANLTFIVWGFYCGLTLAVERFLVWVLDRTGLLDALDNWKNPIFRTTVDVLRVAVVFSLFCIGLIFFNAPNIASSWIMAKQIFTLADGAMFKAAYIGYMLLLTLLLNAAQRVQKWPALNINMRYATAFISGLIVMVAMAKYAPGGGDFIYFQF